MDKHKVIKIKQDNGVVFHNCANLKASKGCKYNKEKDCNEKWSGRFSITLRTGPSKHGDEVIYQFEPSVKICEEKCKGKHKVEEVYEGENRKMDVGIEHMRTVVDYFDNEIMKKTSEDKIKDAVRVILKEIGEDVDREGITATPDRVARMYKNIFYGYKKKLVIMDEKTRNEKIDDDVIPITIFKCGGQDLLIRDTTFTSFCEHHMVPFSGKAYVGIIPDKKLLGMNKIDKIVKYFSARLQIQEVLTKQIVDWINENIQPLGVIVVIKADHYCARLQGDNGEFITSAVRGVFKEDASSREEFLKLIGSIK